MAGFELTTKVKICVLGETVGKSSLVNRFVNDEFSGQQIEHNDMEDIHHKLLELMNQTFNLEITDTTNNDEADRTHDDILQIEWKGMDGYSLDIREEWLINNDILFLCFNRVNRLSWMILQALYEVSIQYLKKNNLSNIPIYIISTCSDLYLSQTSLSNLTSGDLVSFKEVEEYISKFDNVFIYETSSKMNHNIDTIFKASVTKHYELNPRKKKKRKRKKSNAQTLKRMTAISHRPPKTSKPPTLPKPLKSPIPPINPPTSPLFNAEPVDIQNLSDNTKNILQPSKTELMTVETKHTTKDEQKPMSVGNNNESETKHCEKEQIKQESMQGNEETDNKHEILLKNETKLVEDEENKDDEQKLMEDEENETNLHLQEEQEEKIEHNGHNGYDGYKKKDNKSNLKQIESPFSLSSTEIYNIEYSSKYKESMDFKNIQKTFDKYHQIKLFYEQHTQNGLSISTDHVFFKDLDATLTTIGCIDHDKKKFFINCRQHIIYKMLHSINICKNQYEYLANITLLTGPLELTVEELDNNKYWGKLSDASFISKLNINYDEWMKDNKKSENEFKNELSGALHINPIYIMINGVGRGLTDIVIDWTVMYIWIPYYIQGVESNLIYREYRMRPQDQIEVEYSKKWIPCTILEVKDTLNKNGKQIKVRYNKLYGNDRFYTNTEWLWTVKQYQRLRLPDQVYCIVSYNGVKIGTTFKPPLLAYCRCGNKQLLHIGQHIFVNRKNIWYRCEIVDVVKEDGKAIHVLYLVNKWVKSTEWIRLFEPDDLKRISLQDMRM